MLPKILSALLFAALAAQASNARSGNDGEAPPAKSLDLSGEWRFQLDPKNAGLTEEWFNRTLPESIELPGSCEQRGFGEKNQKPEVLRLTRVIKYIGPAWYQRDIEIPAEWSGKRVELFLERCMWESTVWIDGKKVGMQNSLSTPHQYDLGVLKPGKHTVTVCVDNTYKLKIGHWGHSITEDTQGLWNGIIGRIELRATDPVWIRSAQVFPDKIKVSLGNATGESQKGTIAGTEVVIPKEGGEFELPFSRPSDAAGWDEFSPKMQQVELKLIAGKYSDELTVPYAVRDLVSKDRQFILNGRPLFMRGPVDEAVYPLTGYPPMDKESWLRVIGIAKSYGFNFMRFHSWCPPKAAFEAADEMGFLFQIEVPLWTAWVKPFGEDEPRDQFIREELKRILETYGNHPSLGFIGMGNESEGDLKSLVDLGRGLDSRPLFRNEGGWGTEFGQYLQGGQRGIFGPRTDWDRWMAGAGWIAGSDHANTKIAGGPPVPMFAHEIGQWAMYPNLDEVKKYTGTLRAHTFERWKKSLTENHMLDQAQDFSEASGKFSVLLYKDEIEGSLRSWPYGGVQILNARDYPGQGVAIVGWLDAFWDSKGLITPEKFREFCAPTVCLLAMPKRVLSTEENFTAKAKISHYGPEDIEVSPTWSIADDAGQEIASGQLPKTKLETGHVTTLGDISVPLQNIKTAKHLTVTLRAGDTQNSWSIWAYPPVTAAPSENVKVVSSYDDATRKMLAEGARVLLLSPPTLGVIYPKNGFMLPPSARALPAEVSPGKNAIPGSFIPTFWNLQLFNQIGTLGMLIDPSHPALAGFPTENHSDWQWADLLGNFSAANTFGGAGAGAQHVETQRKVAGDKQDRSKAFILSETPPEYRPIVQVIDNQERNAKLGNVFETKVGPGRLLVCGIDLETDLADRPAAQQLRKSLLDYAASDKFAPKFELPESLLVRLLTDDGKSGDVKSGNE